MRFEWQRTKTDQVDTNTNRDIEAAKYLAAKGQFFSYDLTEKIEAYHWLSSFENQPELAEAAAKIRKSVEVDTWLRYRLSFGIPDVEDTTEVWRQYDLDVLAMEALIQYELTLMFGTVGKHPSLGGPPLTVATLETDPAGARKRVVAQLTRQLENKPVPHTITDENRAALAALVKQEYRPGAAVVPPQIPVVDIPAWELAAVEEVERFTAMSAEEMAAQERNYTAQALGLLAELGKPMATYSHAMRRLLARLARGERLYPIERYSRHCSDLGAFVRDRVAGSRSLTPVRAAHWDITLVSDGFTIDVIKAKIDGLEQKIHDASLSEKEFSAAYNQLLGYQFQVLMTMEAWRDYRLIDVERPLLNGTRFVDTVECVGSAGSIRYREYKAYNPNGGHSPAEQQRFNNQFAAYAKALGKEETLEYVFKDGSPQWARNTLVAGAAGFTRGLWLTDASTGVSEQLNPNATTNDDPMEVAV